MHPIRIYIMIAYTILSLSINSRRIFSALWNENAHNLDTPYLPCISRPTISGFYAVVGLAFSFWRAGSARLSRLSETRPCLCTRLSHVLVSQIMRYTVCMLYMSLYTYAKHLRRAALLFNVRTIFGHQALERKCVM